MTESSATNESLVELAEAAFAVVARKVVVRALQSDTPVVLWENNQVSKQNPENLTSPETVSFSK